MVTLTIDNKVVTAPEGATILEAARGVGIVIPTLCEYQPLYHTPGSCRICVVEVSRNRNLVASCVHPAADGMVIQTNSLRVRRARRVVLEMLLSDHPNECTTCRKSPMCELRKLAETFGVETIRIPQTDFKDRSIDRSSPSLVRDSAKCINCGRCVVACDRQTVSLLTPRGRGFTSRVVPAMDADLSDAVCSYCGQCAVVCPTGAIMEKDDTDRVWEYLDDSKKHVVVQEAPAVRAQLGEGFGLPAGTLVTGKMIAALRRLGFDRVFDTNFTADLTIMEEGHELLHRIETGKKLPMITSCSPGWIKFIEHFYPSLLGHVSTCKSPQQMFGALAKTYYAETAGIDPADIVVVSVMPCTAKKFEANRQEMCASGFQDVDVVLTTRELIRMIREAGIDFGALPDEVYDEPMGYYTGAATIFGTTGGVMEAALRTVYEVVTHQKLSELNITTVRGLDGIKSAVIEVGSLKEVRAAVAHGLGNARILLDQIQKGISNYHFIEIMACQGGCVGGGGQPLPTSEAILNRRAAALYFDDEKVQEKRASHENPSVRKLYETFLEKPLGEKSHALLHTHYIERGMNPRAKNKG